VHNSLDVNEYLVKANARCVTLRYGPTQTSGPHLIDVLLDGYVRPGLLRG